MQQRAQKDCTVGLQKRPADESRRPVVSRSESGGECPSTSHPPTHLACSWRARVLASASTSNSLPCALDRPRLPRSARPPADRQAAPLPDSGGGGALEPRLCRRPLLWRIRRPERIYLAPPRWCA